MRNDTEEQSLETLEEWMEKRWSTEDDDEEVALQELIDAIVPLERMGGPSVPGDASDSEFICTSCHLIRPLASLVDADRGICSECDGGFYGWIHRRVPA